MMAPTKVKGNSRASAGVEAKSPVFFFAGCVDGLSSGLSSEGIVSEPCERLRIQPRGESNKYCDAKGQGLPIAHRGTRRFARLLQPGVHDNAEVVVKRGNDVQNCENGQHWMLRFDERKENEVLAHEAGGGRNTS